MDDDELSSLIRHHASRHRAGEGLRAAVNTQLALQAARDDSATQAVAPRWAADRRGVLAGFAAGVALSAGLGWLGPLWLQRDTLPADIVAEHVRALGTGALVEVSSGDRHAVKPWFQGRLDYAPPVVDLSDQGFPLLGGRVATVDGMRVAAMAYTRRRHVIHVFAWPARKAQAPAELQLRGFNLQHWSDGAMQTWVVSDLDGDEMAQFARAWRSHTAPAARP